MSGPANGHTASLLVKPEEAARLLQLSRAKVYQLIASKELPSIKSGANRRIARSDLDAYIARLRDEDRHRAA